MKLSGAFGSKLFQVLLDRFTYLILGATEVWTLGVLLVVFVTLVNRQELTFGSTCDIVKGNVFDLYD